MVPTQYFAETTIPAQSYLCAADTADFPFLLLSQGSMLWPAEKTSGLCGLQRPAKGQGHLPHSMLLLHLASDLQYPCWSPHPGFPLLILSPDLRCPPLLPVPASPALVPINNPAAKRDRRDCVMSPRLQPAANLLLAQNPAAREVGKKRQSWGSKTQCRQAGYVFASTSRLMASQ